MSKEQQLVSTAVKAVSECKLALFRFITANDVGATGGHQSGFHLPKQAWRLYFDREGKKGETMDKMVKIRWFDGPITDSRFIYYGEKTRNEYRLTRFGRDFPFLRPDNIGDLLVLVKRTEEDYEGFVLSHDTDIEDFLASFNLSTEDSGRLIDLNQDTHENEVVALSPVAAWIQSLGLEFPKTEVLAAAARNFVLTSGKLPVNGIIDDPDTLILAWLEMEYSLFKIFENQYYSSLTQKPFESVEQLIETANSILNRRKSRAGKSLEHHLAEIFTMSNLQFSAQAVTEGNKKPDFIFPGSAEYQDAGFPDKKLIFLGAKTTCKDRWRQILNEADRIKTKHLFTLQQGISANQLEEMKKHNVQLVIPRDNLKAFPPEYREDLLVLKSFVDYVKHIQDNDR